MKLKIKRLNKKAVLPSYAHQGDAGLDLTATSRVFDEFGNVSYGTGLAISVPEGHVGLLFSRSSNCKKDLLLNNAVGVLDSSYTGEVFFKYKPSAVFSDKTGKLGSDSLFAETIELPIKENWMTPQIYEIGDRIGQLIIIPYPTMEIEEVEELSTTERGTDGFGSTGN
jgi:dUTP pyrophosphatase